MGRTLKEENVETCKYLSVVDPDISIKGALTVIRGCPFGLSVIVYQVFLPKGATDTLGP